MNEGFPESPSTPEKTWPGKDQGLPPPMTAEYGVEYRKQERLQKKETYLSPTEIKKNLLEGEQPLTKEEKIQFLRPEILSSLSTEEYMRVWKRLSNHFVSHVTRQGVREAENSHVYHTHGLHERHNGLSVLLEAEKSLQSKSVREGSTSPDVWRDEAQKILDTTDFSKPITVGMHEEFPNPWNVVKRGLTGTIGVAPAIPDEVAIHFAADRV